MRMFLIIVRIYIIIMRMYIVGGLKFKDYLCMIMLFVVVGIGWWEMVELFWFGESKSTHGIKSLVNERYISVKRAWDDGTLWLFLLCCCWGFGGIIMIVFLILHLEEERMFVGKWTCYIMQARNLLQHFTHSPQRPPNKHSHNVPSSQAFHWYTTSHLPSFVCVLSDSPNQNNSTISHQPTTIHSLIFFFLRNKNFIHQKHLQLLGFQSLSFLSLSHLTSINERTYSSKKRPSPISFTQLNSIFQQLFQKWTSSKPTQTKQTSQQFLSFDGLTLSFDSLICNNATTKCWWISGHLSIYHPILLIDVVSTTTPPTKPTFLYQRNKH